MRSSVLWAIVALLSQDAQAMPTAGLRSKLLPAAACLGLAVLLIAGCAAPRTSPQAAIADEPMARPDEPLAIDVLVSPGGPGGCNVQGCWVAAYPHLLLRTPMDAVLHAVDLEVGVLRGVERVRWELTCVQAAERDEPQPDGPCHAPLAEGEGELPATVTATRLQLAPRTAILLKLTYPAIEPAVDAMFGGVTGQSRVTGHALVERLPPALVPAIVVVPKPFTQEVHSGPCVIVVEPDCGLIGGGYLWDEQVDGNVYSMNVTMTWDATSPADAELGLRLGGRSPERGPDIAVVGSSPLVVDAAAVEYGDEVFFIVFHPDPARVMEGPGLRTPVHVEGTLWVEPWAEAEE